MSTLLMSNSCWCCRSTISVSAYNGVVLGLIEIYSKNIRIFATRYFREFGRVEIREIKSTRKIQVLQYCIRVHYLGGCQSNITFFDLRCFSCMMSFINIILNWQVLLAIIVECKQHENNGRNLDNLIMYMIDDISVQQLFEKPVRHVHLFCQFTSVVSERQLERSR